MDNNYVTAVTSFSQNTNIAVAVSVTACIVCSVAFFIIGFLCGHFAHVCRRPKSLSESVSPSEERPTVPRLCMVMSYHNNRYKN